MESLRLRTDRQLASQGKTLGSNVATLALTYRSLTARPSAKWCVAPQALLHVLLQAGELVFTLACIRRPLYTFL